MNKLVYNKFNYAIVKRMFLWSKNWLDKYND